MPEYYGAIVIGSGAAGGYAARALKAAGRSVAMIESGDFGGTCALRGCEPKKVLAETAHAVARARELMARNGVRGELSIHWPDLATLKQKYVGAVPPRAESSYESAGIDLYYGRAAFTGPDRVAVDGEELAAPAIIIATGSRPRTPDFPGAHLLATSDDFLNLQDLPRRIVFLGGGYIAMEFAQIAAIAGADVTVAVRGDRCLRRFEPELAGEVAAAARTLGAKVLFEAAPHSLERSGLELTLRLGPDGSQAVVADLVVNCLGRVPNLEGLDPGAAGLELRDGALVLDDFLRTSNPNVWAAGDVAGRFQLTPTAVMEGRAVASSLLGLPVKPDYSLVPACVFTHPPLAGVGLTEERARAAGTPYEVKSALTLSWPELTRLGIRHSGYKLLLEPGSGRLLGLHYLGESAQEVVNAAALIMRQGLTKAQIMDIVWSYPSFGYAIRYMLS